MRFLVSLYVLIKKSKSLPGYFISPSFLVNSSPASLQSKTPLNIDFMSCHNKHNF